MDEKDTVTAAMPVRPLGTIEGIYVAHLRLFEDERGRFMETFRRDWFPWVDWSAMQTNRSDSVAGVLRGLHYHLNQADYWYVQTGEIRVGLADLRPESPTYRATLAIGMDDENHIGLFIPPGVAHGFVALTDSTLTYVVNKYYNDGADENGVAWDDPDLAIPWEIDDPVLSPRDAENPTLRQIPPNRMPL